MKTNINAQKKLSSIIVAAIVLIQSTVVLAQYDTAQYPRIENPIYFGYEIGVGAEYQKVFSTIPQLENMPVVMHGATAGIKLANTRGALRANVGLYYSGGNVAQTIDMIKGGVSGSLYLLRMKKVVYRNFEPYALMSVTYHQSKFFGSYLHSDKKNRSVSEDPELGKVNWWTTSLGAGVEFQLENHTYQFIHFFAEAKYGIPVYAKGSNTDFSQTQIKAPLTFTLGMSFGKFK